MPVHVASRMWSRWQPDRRAKMQYPWLPPEAPDFSADVAPPPTALSAPLGKKPQSARKVLFSAIFLEDGQASQLLRRFPPMHPLVSANHVPLEWGPSLASLSELPFGRSVMLRLTGRASDACAQVLTIEVRFRACLIPGARMVSLSEHAATPIGAR